MAKNLVVCCDGTGNQFGESNSNVVKLYRTLVRDSTQIAYYHPGVGTMGSRNALSALGKWWTRVIGLAFGYGISDNVADAYQFLMRNYHPDDKLFVFGFSRGAYTARALCGMLHVIGLMTEGNEGLIPYAIRLIKAKHIDFDVAFDFKRTFSRPCKPHFVGVWDTVSSVGWVYNAVTFPYTRATKNPDLHIVRHAVSIDERRAFFPSNSFGKPFNDKQDVKEVWFAGVHSDVGGSYPEDESQLSKIALKWMLEEAELAQLKIDSHRKAQILGPNKAYVAPDATTKNQHESLRGFWWHLAELWPKFISVEVEPDVWEKRVRVNRGRSRPISSEPPPLVHVSVEERLEYSRSAGLVTVSKKGIKKHPFPYQPRNLPEKRVVVHDSAARGTGASGS